MKILFLCTGNSCRSQMAEGWARALCGEALEPYSAGIEAHGLNPRAVRVMAEAGVDISGHRSKPIRELAGVEFDRVVTLCGHADEHCPAFPAKTKVVHAGFDDPPKLAEDAKTEQEALEPYRRVRDEIKTFVLGLEDLLARSEEPGAGPQGGAGHFDRAAATWDDNVHRQLLTEAVARAVRAAVPLKPESSLLEYGCGTAALSVLLSPGVGRIVAADASEGMLAEVGRKLAETGLTTIRPLRLDLARDPLPEDRFDVVVSSMTLHHIDDMEQILAALANLLREDGWLAIADLCPEDGSFHPDRVVPHQGIDPESLAASFARLGLEDATWQIAHHLARNGREYQVFLATARRRRRAGSRTGATPEESVCGASESQDPADVQQLVHERVREGYGKIAREGGSCCGASPSCCGSGSADQIAQAVGYSEGELAALPEGANLGLSCGNPTALASLRPGEVVLDLGSGGGFDVFIAGRKVGAAGRAIGVDMTADMLGKARRNAADYRARTGLDNVEFRLGEIEHLPVADASVDVVISNCVLNLSPEKAQVWREIARVLKPGGRIAVSDLALLQPLPEAVLKMVEALVGCLAGAVLADHTRHMAEAAGLADIVLSPKAGYADAMADWNDPLYRAVIEALPADSKVGDFITSLDVSARKPAAGAPPKGACCTAREARNPE